MLNSCSVLLAIKRKKLSGQKGPFDNSASFFYEDLRLFIHASQQSRVGGDEGHVYRIRNILLCGFVKYIFWDVELMSVEFWARLGEWIFCCL